MSQTRDGSLPRRQFARTRSQMPQVNSESRPNEENISSGPSRFHSLVSMSGRRRALDRVGMTSRPGPDRVLQQRNSNRKESSRSQRFNLSDDDSDMEEAAGESQQESQDSVDKLASQLFGGSKKGKGKASTQAVAGTQIVVKPEPQRSQSLRQSPDPPIDLTIATTDDDAPPPSTTQNLKSTSKSSINSSQGGLNGKKVMKKKKARTQVIGKARLQGMISGGSGKSENDSIVLLHTDEEDGNAVAGPVTSVSLLSLPKVTAASSLRLAHLTWLAVCAYEEDRTAASQWCSLPACNWHIIGLYAY